MELTPFNCIIFGIVLGFAFGFFERFFEDLFGWLKERFEPVCTVQVFTCKDGIFEHEAYHVGQWTGKRK